MQINKLGAAYLILILLVSSVLTISVSSEGDPPPFWNESWPYRQEIKIPVSTDNPYAKYQPIDIRIEFEKNCWAKNENEHSVRVCCWDGNIWHDLESQIYHLNFTDVDHIYSCGLVFLIPEIADGKERYFIYYDDNEKPSPNYIDHVSIEDEYYYYEPISGISVEGDYYKITEDNYIIYVVGQKGQVMDRKLSQCVIKMKHNTEKFEIMNSDILASFAFSYHHGVEDKHEISSDQLLVSKEIAVDGNLMVELGIISESSNKELRTTNIYKYYYCPTIDKRISVKVNHEVLEDVLVKGIVNVDGRYGALLSLKSKSIAIKKMCFGEILPYIHVYGENDRIKEYKMNKNPEGKEREWIISYSDDCDIGRDAWISYDEGDSGKCHAILFSSNEGIVKQGTSERDGIEVKVAVREYLDVVGTEVDYASITFGRNSYEKGDDHDVNIPGDLRVEFEAEFFTVEDGNYEDVAEEGKLFRTLVKHRYEYGDDLFEGDQNIHTLTIIPHMSGRIISYPHLVNLTGLALPVTWIELYQNDTLISSGAAHKPFIGFQTIKFPKLISGEYVIKIYRKIGNDTKNYIGVGSVKIEEDIVLHIYCTWQKSIKLTTHDQHDKHIRDIELVLLNDNIIVLKNTTGDAKETTLNVPFNLFDSYALLKGKQIKGKMLSFPFNLSDPYVLKAFYKGFIIYDDEIARLQKSADIGIDLYDLTVNIEDKLGLRPGVDVRPFLTSSEMYRPLEIIPKDMGNGKYLFERLPAATYEFQISYGAFSDRKTIHVPEDGNHASIIFTANFDLTTELLNSRGEHVQEVNHKIEIIRGGWKIHEPVSSGEIISLPPGKYTINVYSESKLIGSKSIELTNDRNIKIVTTIESILPTIVTGVVLIFIGELVVLLLLFKKISLNSFLKLMAMAIILASLFQPWWMLDASSDEHLAEKNSAMYIIPPTMIDSITYEDKLYLDLATIPEVFTNFLEILLIIVCSGLILMGVSFIPNVVLRRHFSLGLISASILFLILVSAAFSFGMSKICEMSLGSLQGEGILDITLPTGETAYMAASWGLGIGFYLCIVPTLILVAAGIIDFLRKKKWLKLSFTKK